MFTTRTPTSIIRNQFLSPTFRQIRYQIIRHRNRLQVVEILEGVRWKGSYQVVIEVYWYDFRITRNSETSPFSHLLSAKKTSYQRTSAVSESTCCWTKLVSCGSPSSATRTDRSWCPLGGSCSSCSSRSQSRLRIRGNCRVTHTRRSLGQPPLSSAAISTTRFCVAKSLSLSN